MLRNFVKPIEVGGGADHRYAVEFTARIREAIR